MFGLIRRISHSVIPRPDRPWADDPTSNAPQKGRKRRLSATEREQDVQKEESLKKKIRGESTASDAGDLESKAVKEVTRGVRDVDLEADGDQKEIVEADNVAPEAVPLPDEESGELDEPSTVVAPTLEAEGEVDDVDDNASSVNEEPETNELSNPAVQENAEEESAIIPQDQEEHSPVLAASATDTFPPHTIQDGSPTPTSTTE
ncbi:hypothetical protein H0H81_000031 [Sphagnurus paluster]|uniref:Uncharacterized protein n=1 Tax=Sphagnurus paluster TaxID=117069 RepID=A0A9P7K9D4_9AGAR|nr:hypothetical protein H0H81_000031 [Sphagnurus paluster]